jgi:glycosyltransferase involved in cell wall biosynthesis
LLQAGYIANEARRLKATHFHAQFANGPTTVAHLASRITGIPFSFTAHATDIFKTGVSGKALSHKARASQFVVTVSEFNKRYLEEVCAGSAKKIVRVYNGIDLDRFAPNGQPPMAPFRFVCVARLVEKKGLPVLVEAARLLKDRGLEFEIDLIGKGRLRSPLRDQIRAAGLERQVHLIGPKTQLEVLAYFHAAHAAVLPAIVGSDGNREGLPVSITEALACGLPVVSTPVTGIPEAVEDGVNGLLVPPGDAPALAGAMERLLTEDGLYPALRAHARASVEARFDRRKTAEHLVELFRKGAR